AGVEHEDGIVAQPLDEDAEPLLALRQRDLRRLELIMHISHLVFPSRRSAVDRRAYPWHAADDRGDIRASPGHLPHGANIHGVPIRPGLPRVPDGLTARREGMQFWSLVRSILSDSFGANPAPDSTDAGKVPITVRI